MFPIYTLIYRRGINFKIKIFSQKEGNKKKKPPKDLSIIVTDSIKKIIVSLFKRILFEVFSFYHETNLEWIVSYSLFVLFPKRKIVKNSLGIKASGYFKDTSLRQTEIRFFFLEF